MTLTKAPIEIDPNQEMLTRRQVEYLTHLSAKTLARHGVPRVRLGRTVRYPQAAVRKFLADRMETGK